MKVVLAFDDGYVAHGATAMASAIAGASERLEFVVLHAGLSDENQRILSDFFRDKVESLSFHLIDSVAVGSIPGIYICDRYSLSAYLRLFAADFIDDDVAIYIDSDLVVLGDVVQMVREADPEKAVSACSEYDVRFKLVDEPRLGSIHRAWSDPVSVESDAWRMFRRLDMRGGRYFNAGILVLNLRRWREECFLQRCVDFISCHQCNHDQDAMNGVLDGDYGTLHPRWNNHVLSWGVFSGYSDDELIEARDNPSVVHFTGTMKPWYYRDRGRYHDTYWHFRRLTPWPEHRYADRTVRDVVAKHTPRFIKKILGR